VTLPSDPDPRPAPPSRPAPGTPPPRRPSPSEPYDGGPMHASGRLADPIEVEREPASEPPRDAPDAPPAEATAAPPAAEQAPADEPPRQPATLRNDLDEVGRARPERSFNVGAALGILLTIAAVIFVVQNNRSTDFEWLWFDFTLPLWTVLVGTLVVGALLVLTALAVHRWRKRRIARRRAATGRLREALVTEDDAPAPRRWGRRPARA
jgi:uncharacterized integral membrane protein